MKLAIDGFCEQLRAPESLHQLVMLHKPATQSAGDFALASMLNAVLMALIVRGDYRGIQRLLVSLFGDLVTDVTKSGRAGRVVTTGDK